MSSTEVPVGHLDDARRADGAADGDQRRAGRGRSPDGREPRSAEAGDQGEVREGLRVLHEGGPARGTALERAVGIDGHADAIADPVGERALLARHVAGRRRHQPDGQGVDAGGGALVEGRVEYRHEGGAAVHGDEGVGRADGARSERDAVEHEVGRLGDEDGVLAARGLALHRVRDDDGMPGAAQATAPGGALDDRAKLPLGGEPAAAAPAQASRRHLVARDRPGSTRGAVPRAAGGRRRERDPRARAASRGRGVRSCAHGGGRGSRSPHSRAKSG